MTGGVPRTFEVITTCSAKGWDEYGMRMACSYEEHWPATVPLRIYAEGFVPTGDFATVRALPDWLSAFKAKHSKNPKANGMTGRGPYNYRFDAVRFAHKTAAVIDAVERSDRDIVIWIDADTVTHSRVTLDFLREMAPGADRAISWLDRKNKYPECGFYMLDRRNLMVDILVEHWKALYTSGMLFHLPEWHDSYVLEVLVKKLQVGKHSISGAGFETGHPFVNGPLGAVMDHMKGNRKAKGVSRATDLKVERREAYWKGIKK